jgi:hypothetical protein
MALLLSPETYKLLEKRLGEEEAREIVKALGEALEATDKQNKEAIVRIESKADSLITQKKFELKDELTKELATKADIARLEGMIKVVDEKFKVIEERFKSLNFKLNLFIAIALLALTFANPTFVNLIERLFK